MPPVRDHPLRFALANELHARPFPVLDVPSVAAFVALCPEGDVAARDHAAERAHLLALLDRHGTGHPPPGATHFFGPVGRAALKWESHTEFLTYTAFAPGLPGAAFAPEEFGIFPDDWLAAAPGLRLTSALIRIEPMPEDEDEVARRVAAWFVPESLAIARVLDSEAIVAGDFRVDPSGHMRFAVFVRPGISARRVGRIVQRLCEIETYKTMSMLGLAEARRLTAAMGPLDTDLSACVAGMAGGGQDAAEVLDDLLAVAGELERLLVGTGFRFGATHAYAALVAERIAALREERFGGRQTFAEFMARRFDPGIRTVRAAEVRLRAMAERAERAGDLLRTRVDVDRSAQNQQLLASMDRRAALQLRLQRTVEGLSVVAISYYAVNLAGYLAWPLIEPAGISRGLATALLTAVVVPAVWLVVRRIRHGME